jgi:5'-nucleotidase
MAEPIRLARILLTNDDGIDAPGLAILAAIAGELADEVWIVAPEHDQSGTSMTLGLHQARRVYPRGARRYAVNGSPGDCVALAAHLMRDNKPQLLLTGINAGSNAGDDTNLSGTVGAALTGLMLKIPSIAISQCAERGQAYIRWDTARQHLPALLQALMQQGWRRDTCLSITLPDVAPEAVKEAVWCRQAPRTITGFRAEQRLDLRGQDYYWLGINRTPDEAAPDTDRYAVRQGQIAISCLGLDRSRPVAHAAIPLGAAAE